MIYFRTLFSKFGLFIVVYIIIGVFVNTAPPHLPTGNVVGGHLLHSWVQYGISIFLWPLSFWTPTFTVSKWMP